MANYNLRIKSSAEKDFLAIPKKDRQRIAVKIQQLADNPRPVGAEKLKGEEYRRLRQGDYRIIYAIDENSKTITIEKIGHRREVYR